MNTQTDKLKTELKSAAYSPLGFLAGLVLGGLAGAATMLLLAPQSGKRTRAQIQLKSMELRDQATEAVDGVVAQTRAKARQITDGVRDKAKELQQSGRDMFDEQKARVVAVIEAAGKQPAHDGAG